MSYSILWWRKSLEADEMQLEEEDIASLHELGYQDKAV